VPSFILIHPILPFGLNTPRLTIGQDRRDRKTYNERSDRIGRTVFTARRYASAVLIGSRKSVCPSVRLSVLSVTRVLYD